MNKRRPFLQHPVHFFYGYEQFLIDEQISNIRNELVPREADNLSYSSFNAKDANIEELVSLATTIPFISKWRVIVLRGVENLRKKQQEMVAEYVKDPSPATSLVLVAQTGRIDRRSRLYVEAEKRGYVKVFKRLSVRQCIQWINRYVQNSGMTISRQEAERIVSLVGNDLRSLVGEMDKVILYSYPDKEVGPDSIDVLVADIKDETVFDLADAIGHKNLRKAISVLKKVADEPPQKVLGAVSRHFRILYRMKVSSGTGGRVPSLPVSLKIPEYRRKVYISMADCFTEAELGAIFRRLRKFDMQIKSGGLPYLLAMNSFLMELCG